VSRKPPFNETDKTLVLTYQLVLTANGVNLHEVERVVFSVRLPEDRRRSILGQRGVHTSAHPRKARTGIWEDSTMRLSAIGLMLTLALGLLLGPPAAEPQPAPKAPRLGLLLPFSSTAASRNREAFLQGLHELGYVEGQTIILEERWAEGKQEQLPALAAELVRLQVEIFVAAEVQSARAARQATERIPVV